MSKTKINVAVIMGGRSTEHAISIDTGTNIINSLDLDKYNVKPLKIEKNGKWIITPGYIRSLSQPINKKELSHYQSGIIPVNATIGLDRVCKDKIDVVFIALHGKYGEDGTIQGFLDMMGIPYTGSGVMASALAMNKIKTMEMYRYHGLTVPDYISIDEKYFKDKFPSLHREIASTLGYPFVLKPIDGGSSAATFLITHPEMLIKAVVKGFKVSERLLLQKYIKGDEVTCAILDTGEESVALPPTQIIPLNSEFFDASAKYKKGATKEITPPLLPPQVILKIQEIGLKAHKILECSGLSRTDMIIQKNNYYVLETNTIPGMTKTSLYPQAAAKMGISFSQLLDKLIVHAINKKR